MTYKKSSKKAFYTKEGFVTVALSWIVLSIMGAVPFVISGSIPHPVDALFETVSGFTTTGASILTDVEALPHCILSGEVSHTGSEVWEFWSSSFLCCLLQAVTT